jgi:Protein of unknown function (DUF4236)
MGLFFRKSIKAGPFRINLSKSGIGVSGGIKGARISTGPRGTELHLGRKGIYYRKKLGGKAQETHRPTQVHHGLQNCVYLTYQSNYFDVLRVLGTPSQQITTGPPEARIPNTIMVYAGRGAVFLAYENVADMVNLSTSHYLGTKAFYPEHVIHVSNEEFRLSLDAYKFLPGSIAPAASYSPAPSNNRRWIILALAVLLFIGWASSNNKPNNSDVQYSQQQVAPTATTKPSPTPQVAKHKRTKESQTTQRSGNAPLSESQSNTALIVSESNPASPVDQYKPATDTTPLIVGENTQRPRRSLSDTALLNNSSSRSTSGHGYIRGPRGGCYYLSGSGRKVYVDRSLCN